MDEDSALSHSKKGISIDHLDSFIRDTQMAGFGKLTPSDCIHRVRFIDGEVHTTEEVAIEVLERIAYDHSMYCHPLILAIDHLLAEAVRQDKSIRQKVEAYEIETDADLLTALQQSTVPQVQKMTEALLHHPERIFITKTKQDGAFYVSVRKTYLKKPYVNGKFYQNYTKSLSIPDAFYACMKEESVS